MNKIIWPFKSKPLRANLHNHTVYSDALLGGTPEDACQTAEVKLDVFAVTDHAEHIRTKKNGGLNMEWHLTECCTRQATQRCEHFYAIRGFEWTSGDAGHINVFGSKDVCMCLLKPSAQAETLSIEEQKIRDGYSMLNKCYKSHFSPRFIDSKHDIIMKFSRIGWNHSDILNYLMTIENFINELSLVSHISKEKLLSIDIVEYIIRYKTHEGDSKSAVNLKDFYEWLINNQSCIYDNVGIVAQFNHPSWRGSGNCFEEFSRTVIPNGDLDRLDQIFTLCEVGSKFDPYVMLDPNRDFDIGLNSGIGDGLDKKNSNEYWYRLALSKGWKLAPVLNEDNHLGTYGDDYDYTGLWMEPDSQLNKQAQVMNALRNKRVFVAEKDHSFYLKFAVSLKCGGLDTIAYMGDTLMCDNDNWNISLYIGAGTNESAIGDIYAVFVYDSVEDKPVVDIKYLFTASVLSVEKADILIEPGFIKPELKAVYIKIQRPHQKESALSSPVFFSWKT